MKKPRYYAVFEHSHVVAIAKTIAKAKRKTIAKKLQKNEFIAKKLQNFAVEI